MSSIDFGNPAMMWMWCVLLWLCASTQFTAGRAVWKGCENFRGGIALVEEVALLELALLETF